MIKGANKLDRAFNPGSVAVVGDKQLNNYMWLRCLSTFKGEVYSVQIDEKEVPGIEALGVKNYFSLLDIPGPVDYVIVATPRSVAPKIVSDCIRKEVGAVTLFTAGFAETNTEEGIRLQNAITEMARQADLKLIGPNCMGIFNPKIGLRMSVNQYSGESGPVGFISQSGGHSARFSEVAALNGVKLSKSVSYGNGIVLDSTDYLEYLAEDEETRIIGMYIEGVKDGRRFFRSLREIARRKPVVIWKGGQTEEGARATASHTASLAGPGVIWEALIRQCGAIKADSLDELVDIAKSLVYIEPTTGTRVGLIAMAGGQAVVITDAFSKAGLEVPLLAERSYQQFASFFNTIGSSYRNPLDISSNFFGVEDPVKTLRRMLEILEEDDNTDTVALELAADYLIGRRQENPAFLNSLLGSLSDYRNSSKKAFLVVLVSGRDETLALELRGMLAERGIPSFPSFERGAKALKKIVDYYVWKGDAKN